MAVTVGGSLRHQQAVDALRRSYAAIPSDDRVRLAKRTSNLFRPRNATHGPGLDVSGLTGVIEVDPARRTADVQGMCTYEDLVDATLPHGLMPLVVPQLRTITLGGAVTGLGIESSSFRNGLPHESVLEMDILTGDGRIVTATPDGPDAALYRAFPNSYGSLGYAIRLRIELEPVQRYVALHHVRFRDFDSAMVAVTEISRDRSWQEQPVDFLDGVVFGPDETYLTLGRWTETLSGTGLMRPSDYTGQEIFYRSLRERERDVLIAYDYLWRWDTDWFWCSRAFGAQHPVGRRLWPGRYRRSDVYHRIVGIENRFGLAARIDRWRGRPARERVVQDVEIPVERAADFLRWFIREVPMTPIWLCPLALREVHGSDDVPAEATAPRWPLYPLHAGQLYVNVGFWGTVPIGEGAVDGDANLAIEEAVAEHGGHKSLYSDAYYDEQTFDRLYGGETYRKVKQAYDPEHRLTGMYEKVVGRA